MLSEFCSRSYFFPTIQLRPAAGARTLLHIGTHRREYSDLDPNHLYYMQWRLKGLERCPFVEDVTLAESRDTYRWIFEALQETEEHEHVGRKYLGARARS